MCLSVVMYLYVFSCLCAQVCTYVCLPRNMGMYESMYVCNMFVYMCQYFMFMCCRIKALEHHDHRGR